MSVRLVLLDRADSGGRAVFQLTEPYPYHLGPGCVVTVPIGYVTNFGTIPRWLSWVVSPSQLREAAIVHDWMCEEDLVDDGVSVHSGYSRWLADAVLYEAMARLGFGWWKRSVVYAAVRTWAILTKQQGWPEQPEALKV